MKKMKMLLGGLIFLIISYTLFFYQDLYGGFIKVEDGRAKVGFAFGSRYRKDREDSLLLRISLDKERFSFQEKVYLKIIFKNIGQGAKRIVLYEQLPKKKISYSYYKIFIRDSKGKEMVYNLKERFEDFQLPLVEKLIKPNQEISFSISFIEKVRQLYPDFYLEPGDYSIFVEYDPRSNYQDIGCWSARLFSNPLKFSINK